MAYQQVVGDLQVNDAESVDGWCWDPARPTWHVPFEILVDDRPMGSGLAALPRPDLARRGMTHTAHGFALRLPAGAIDRSVACLVSARARDSGIVFGRKRVDPGAAVDEPSLLAVQAGLGALSEQLAGRPQTIVPRDRWRMSARRLSERLRAQAGGGFAGATGARTRAPQLYSGQPAATLVVPRATASDRTRALLSALMAARLTLPAEVLLLDGGDDPQHRILPSVLAGLRRVESWQEAVGIARSAWVVLLEAAPPSLSGILTLVERLDSVDVPVLLASSVDVGSTVVGPAAEAPLGVRCALRREVALGGSRAAALAARLARP